MSSKINIDTRLYQGLNESEKEDFKQYYLNCTQVREQLIKVVQSKLDSIETSSEKDYNSNDWAYLQADRNGQTRVLKDLLKLLTPTERKQ
jgi:predicted O-methyltransferase YrrM